MVLSRHYPQVAILGLPVFLAASAHAASKHHSCGGVIEGNDLRWKRNLHFDLPFRDRVPYPDIRGNVMCSVVREGRLRFCFSSITDPRGAALSRQVSRWRVLTHRLRGCPVIGRKVVINIRLQLADS
jgi:hypothetical protein